MWNCYETGRCGRSQVWRSEGVAAVSWVPLACDPVSGLADIFCRKTDQNLTQYTVPAQLALRSFGHSMVRTARPKLGCPFSSANNGMRSSR